MTREEFKAIMAELVAQAERECDNPIDLRASRSPYHPWHDNEVFCIDDLDSAYDFVESSEEWYIDIYENYTDENRAEYIDITLWHD